jgi:hypothetical protein
MTLVEIADALDAAGRHGAATDEPEGMRYITITDTLARQLAAGLRDHALADAVGRLRRRSRLARLVRIPALVLAHRRTSKGALAWRACLQLAWAAAR